MLKIFPGLILASLTALIAYVVTSLPVFPFTVILDNHHFVHPIEPMAMALFMGIVIAYFIPEPNPNNIGDTTVSHKTRLFCALPFGLQFCISFFLPVGIALMGLKFDVTFLMQHSSKMFMLNFFIVALAFLVVTWLSKPLKVEQNLATLIAFGTAICGSSAIVAAAPAIKAKNDHITLAITTITLFGLIAVFLFPLIGRVCHLSNDQFGVWIGMSIQTLPQVVAAGYSFSAPSGDMALIVKMVRILLLGPMLVLICSRQKMSKSISLSSWQDYFPPFIIAFITIALLNSMGIVKIIDNALPGLPLQELLLQIASALLTLAITAVGLSSQLKKMLLQSQKALLLSFIAATFIALLSFILIMLFM